jgi:hypothetical protein
LGQTVESHRSESALDRPRLEAAGAHAATAGCGGRTRAGLFRLAPDGRPGLRRVADPLSRARIEHRGLLGRHRRHATTPRRRSIARSQRDRRARA